MPKIHYKVSNISSRNEEVTKKKKKKKKKEKTIKETNKIIKFVKENKSYITFVSLHFPSTKITMYSDASFNNASNCYSQGGHILYTE